MDAGELDSRVRRRAFEFLAEQNLTHGDVLPREILAQGFQFDDIRVPLIGPQGIFKPAILPAIPLSITTAPPVEGRDPPYADEVGPHGLLLYRYRGTDPNHRENVGLRNAAMHQIPLVYLYGVVPGRYMPLWPVFVVYDDPARLTFTVAVDDRQVVGQIRDVADSETALRRRYCTIEVRKRLHQEGFRQRVLRAYRQCCAICRLRHEELLDAAHILPDGHPRGEPIIPNGLALCRLHHAAFDRHLLGIRPDLLVEIRLDVLKEEDGPMLRHGLQGFQGARIQIPAALHLRPNPEFMEERYEIFKRAG